MGQAAGGREVIMLTGIVLLAVLAVATWRYFAALDALNHREGKEGMTAWPRR